ncbi:hypothetical protein SH1V18_45690 [Vallitalea longa]|uniref:DUF4044 domain-containing protein n=1 Tax=Vallitalea longa TaxID=2936439 RepID=A0A9W6DIN4_9FIRM|nr:hypothetical protein SH1V18_45690 [Vallitalea longa]
MNIFRSKKFMKGVAIVITAIMIGSAVVLALAPFIS